MLVSPATAGAAGAGGGPIGIVVTRDGSPVARAQVVIRSMPSQAASAAAATGEILDTPVVASGRTNGSGRLQLTPATIGRDRLDADGTANLVAEVTAGGDYLVWRFPLTVGRSSSGAGHRTVDLRMDVGSDPGAADMTAPPARWQGMDAKKLTSAGLLRTSKERARAAGASPMIVCNYYWTSSYLTQKNMTIGNEWSWSGAKMSQTYDASVTSTLGVAVNSNGSWSAGGTVGFAVTSAAGGTANGLYNNVTYNQITYRGQTNTCSFGVTYLPYQTVNILYPILGWPVSAHPIWSTCGVYSNADMYKTAGTNLTFGAGVDLGAIKVSANTAWKADNKLTWHFGTSASKLCGSTSAGWASSPEAEAHAY
jgi:hypothetical protein